MGPEIAAALPYLSAGASVLGTLMKLDATNEAQDRQDAAFRANLLRDQDYQSRAINLVNENADQYRPEQRQAAEQKAVDRVADSLTGNLVADREAGQPGAVGGKVSADFTAARAARTASELQRSTDIARLFAKVRGPNDMRAGEAITNADFAARGGSLGADRGFMSSAGSMDAQAAGRPDGGQMLLGEALSTAGAAGLSGSLGGRLAKRAAAPGASWGSGPGTL